MQPVAVHPILFYALLFMYLVTTTMFSWLVYKYVMQIFSDHIILIDRSERWQLIREKLMGRTKYMHDKKIYHLDQDASLLNRRGKALFIFSENKPTPLKIEFNKTRWLSSESLMNVINNDLIQKLVQPASKAKDIFLLLGAAGGMLSAIAAGLILLKTFGVI